MKATGLKLLTSMRWIRRGLHAFVCQGKTYLYNSTLSYSNKTSTERGFLGSRPVFLSLRVYWSRLRVTMALSHLSPVTLLIYVLYITTCCHAFVVRRRSLLSLLFFTDGQHQELMEPFHYINLVPGKDVRGKLIDAFQVRSLLRRPWLGGLFT